LPEDEPRPRAIAIVGSRRCTKYGEQVAYETAYQLAKLGIVIVSGLAYGIDTCAHRGCLDAGGITIAVLGTPIDQIHPRSNEGLAERILERGAIVSELPSGAKVKAFNFSYRNRIVAGLANATLVVEAADKSGTMSTANYTNDQNKSIYAVPGGIYHPMSKGCLNLIKDGAMIYTEPSDLMYEFHIREENVRLRAYKECSLEEQDVICAIGTGTNRDEDILEKTGLTPAEFARCITILQLKKLIKSVGNGEWALV
jgi:DNA processing protein